MLVFPKYITILICIILFGACNKAEYADKVNLGYEYFPLNINSVKVYSVDSTVYSTFTTQPVLYQFNLKDSITSFYLNANNDTVYRIERYKKRKNESDWRYQKTISRFKTARTAEEILDNKNYIRLVFPPELGTSFNANSKNNLNETIVTIDAKVPSFTIGQSKFGETISVYYEEKNLIREDVYKAWYAKSEGLIMNEITSVDKDFNTGKITNGFTLVSKIVK